MVARLAPIPVSRIANGVTINRATISAEVGLIHAVPIGPIIGTLADVTLRSCGSENPTRDTAYGNASTDIAGMTLASYGTKCAT